MTRPYQSINPYSGACLAEFAHWPATVVAGRLEQAEAAQRAWSAEDASGRADGLQRLAAALDAARPALARLMTLEMGKRLTEAEAELNRCAAVCRHYAAEAEALLGFTAIPTQAARSGWQPRPLGLVLAVMPWNFPFWQVFRMAAPALLAGNAVLVKHAENVPQCALALEGLIEAAGLPAGLLGALLIDHAQTADLIGDSRVRAVALTGSERAGRAVAAVAGAALKPCLLELGGADPFIVLADADLDAAAAAAVRGRFQNGGQSCIAAKRWIVEAAVYAPFLERVQAGIEALRFGDPLDPDTTLPPLARADLRATLAEQVQRSVAQGARVVLGGEAVADSYAGYQATLLSEVPPLAPAACDELFGPVASLFRVADAEAALALANSTRFGLGASVWTGDPEHGWALLDQLECGVGFVNAVVRSEARLPFGGVKDSGFGRELGAFGFWQFSNLQTRWLQ